MTPAPPNAKPRPRNFWPASANAPTTRCSPSPASAPASPTTDCAARPSSRSAPRCIASARGPSGSAQKKNGYVGSGVECPTCGQSAPFQGYRSKTVLSVLGNATCPRAYYDCGRCGHGSTPWDRAVGLTPRASTPAAGRLVSLAGIPADSPAEAAGKILPELAGLRVAETTAQRTTAGAGQRLSTQRQQRRVFGFGRRWDWHRDALGRRCAPISLDLTGVRQRAETGGVAEGRMPYVATVCNPVPELPAGSPHHPGPKATMQVRYLAGLYDLDAVGLQLRPPAGPVGTDPADVWIGLTDGGNGLEEFVRRHFPPEPGLALDCRHAADHLTELGQVLGPTDAARRQPSARSWCHLPKHGGGTRLGALLESLARPRRPGVRAKYDAVLGDLRDNVHRMDHPRYRANGWSIGSGAVASACKAVVGQRLKQAGMRWREYGTDGMCHLRALFKSEPGQWEASWQRVSVQKAAA